MNITLEQIDNILQNHFSNQMITNGAKICELSNVIDPWSKGDFDNYWIFSAVLSGLTTNHLRLKYKGEKQLLTSKCDCSNWTEEQHCEHVVALFCYCKKLIHNQNSTGQGPQRTLSETIALKDGFGVFPKKYGTIISGPNQLERANVRSVYTSVQYLLTDNQIISFPLVKNWQGSLIIDITPVDLPVVPDAPFRLVELYQAKFSYIDSESIKRENISIFEYLYLFNWDTGHCFELPNEVKEFVRKIMFDENLLTIDDFARRTQSLRVTKIASLQIEGTDINELPLGQLNFRVSIGRGNKKSSLKLILEAFDDDTVLPIPIPFQLSVFDNGLLSSFKKKADAYNFVSRLIKSFSEEGWNYKSSLRTSGERDYIQEVISYITEYDQIDLLFDGIKKRYQIDTLTIKIFLKAMLASFAEQFFRFSAYNVYDRQLTFDIPKNNLLDGVYNFYSMIKILDIPVYYNKQEIRPWKSSIRFERKNNQFDWFDLNINISNEDLDIIKKADLGSNISLTSKGLVLLDPDQKKLLKLMKKYTDFETDSSHIKEDDMTKYSLPLKRARIFELFELKKMGIDGALTEEELSLCKRLETLEETPEYPMPAIFEDIARPYQKEGYNWLRFLYDNKFGACLADDMGLGKTLQAIMFLESIIDTIDKVLIVCPVSIIINWEKEFLKFSNLKPFIYYGGDRTFDHDAKIVITSYGIMKKESSHQFKDLNFDIMIMDEVQYLKNIRSLGAVSARTLNVKFRICLTGTPVENDLAEFYNILDLSVPGVWGDIRFIKTSSNKKSRLLAKNTVKPFILRRTKDQVLTDLPPKEESVIYLNFSEEENEKYQSSLARIRQKIGDIKAKSKYGEVLKGILELRQLCLWQKRPEIESTKIDYLMANLNQILEEGHQVIIFSQFTTYLDLIQTRVEKKCWKFSRIDGKQPYKKRQKQIDKFQDGTCPIFLISLRAGGVGLNLTAASYIFLMDPWWNPAVENQAIDRAHRIGQHNKLTVYRPIIKDSVEEKVLQLQKRKRELFNDLLNTDNDEFFTGKLSMNDFENLILSDTESSKIE